MSKTMNKLPLEDVRKRIVERTLEGGDPLTCKG